MKLFPPLALAALPCIIPCSILCPILCTAARAQTTPASPSPATTAQLTPSFNGHIVVPVLIHNKKGKLIPSLTAADFTLTDNTHPQTIQSFAPDTSLPLTLGILAQTGPGMGTWLPDQRHYSETFLTHLMPNSHYQAQFFVIQFNRDVDLLENPSPSTAKLHQALHQLGTPQFSGDSNGTVASGAALYDSIYLAPSQVLNKEPGRKALIVFSDGIDRDSKSALNNAIQAAQTTGVTVYAIYLKDAPTSKKVRRHASHGVDGKRILAEICNQTGGEIFASKRASLDSILTQIAQQLNHAYILQYTRTTAANDSGFHHIVLKPRQNNLFVQMTRGYWLPQD